MQMIRLDESDKARQIANQVHALSNDLGRMNTLNAQLSFELDQLKMQMKEKNDPAYQRDEIVETVLQKSESLEPLPIILQNESSSFISQIKSQDNTLSVDLINDNSKEQVVVSPVRSSTALVMEPIDIIESFSHPLVIEKTHIQAPLPVSKDAENESKQLQNEPEKENTVPLSDRKIKIDRSKVARQECNQQ